MSGGKKEARTAGPANSGDRTDGPEKSEQQAVKPGNGRAVGTAKTDQPAAEQPASGNPAGIGAAGYSEAGMPAGRPDAGTPAGRLEAGTSAGRPEAETSAGRPEAETSAGRPEVWPVEPPARPPRLMNPVALAYVGDAVFELLVRQHLAARPNHKPDELHRGAIRYVSAKAQRELLERLQPHLTEEEADIVRRGRNAKSGSPPKGADMSDYRHATALECLFGWLYYEGRFGRMAELLRMAGGDGRRGLSQGG